jgi:glycosyltransferase involved in cell wall biosynthesis
MSPERAAPIVVFGDDWGRHVSTMQHVFRHIVPHRRVFWVNAIGHRYPGLTAGDLRRALEKATRMLRARRPPAAAATTAGPAPEAIIEPRVLPWHHWALVHALNTRSLVRAIRSTLRTHRCPERPIIVTGSPPSVGVLGRLDEIGSVYFCMDDFLALPGVSVEMIRPLERRLLERVDVLVATARSLLVSKAPASKETFYLPQGVNYTHFATPRAEPAEIAQLPKPRIGFAGGISKACDLELLQRLAIAHPEGSIVLVGPVTLENKVLDILSAPNIHLLGAKPYDELPAYVQAFDVGIIPYILSDWTRAVDPLKLLEYLAAGLPVVTTALPEVEKYRSHVRIAEDPDAFVGQVQLALETRSADEQESRRALAQQHTWDHRAAELLALFERLESRNSDSSANATR